MKVKSSCNRVVAFIFFVLLFVLSSFPGDSTSTAAVLPDEYEPDNSYDQAQVIVLNYHTPQNHTFHETNDEDWIMFYALGGETYKIKASNPQVLVCDPVIELFESDGITRIGDPKNDAGPGVEEYLLWDCPADGLYYVRMTNAVGFWGANVWYDLSVDIPGAFSLPGYVNGTVTSDGNGLGGAVLRAGSGSGLSQANGSYIISLESGTYTVTVSKSGYHSGSFSVSVPGGGSVNRNIELVPINNSPPTISGITDTTVGVGILFTLVPDAIDPDGDAITFSVAGKPAWMNFDTSTGTLSGTPDEAHIGQHGPITITVTDTFGASSSLAPFTVTVKIGGGMHFLPAIYFILSK